MMKKSIDPTEETIGNLIGRHGLLFQSMADVGLQDPRAGLFIMSVCHRNAYNLLEVESGKKSEVSFQPKNNPADILISPMNTSGDIIKKGPISQDQNVYHFSADQYREEATEWHRFLPEIDLKPDEDKTRQYNMNITNTFFCDPSLEAIKILEQSALSPISSIQAFSFEKLMEWGKRERTQQTLGVKVLVSQAIIANKDCIDIIIHIVQYQANKKLLHILLEHIQDL